MKGVFALAFGLLLSASIGMWALQPESKPEGKTSLVWVSDDNPLRKEQVALFNKSQPGVHLGLDPANVGMEKIIVQCLGGVGPDLFDCRDANQLSAYVKSGIASDLTEELAARGIDVKKDTWPAMHPTAIYEGKVYGVPTNVAANAIWLNDEVFSRQGVALPKGPWTWAQFVPLAQKLTLRDANGRVTQYGFLFDWWNWAHFLIGFGATIFSDDGTRCVIDSDAAVQAIQTMHDLIYRYKVSPSPVDEASMASAGGWGSGTINLFGAKRAAMALGGRWWLANLRNFKGLDLSVVESPYGLVRAFGAVGRATLVNANSPHRKAAIDFVAFLASEEYGHLINDQADGIAAFRQLSTGQEYLINEKYPQETYNATWREVTALAVPLSTSPYVNGQAAFRIIDRQLDLVRINAKPARQALRDAAIEVNSLIKATLDGNPSLRARWDKAVQD